MRREFRLPEADETYLNLRGLPWETILEGSTRWLLIHRYPAPGGYNRLEVSAALLVVPGYPDTGLDMVYVDPHLSLSNGRPIRALATQSIDGKAWQRWSRHRTAANPWRAGFDGIETHLLLVDEWLRREVTQ